MLSIRGADSVTRLAETDTERAATVWPRALNLFGLVIGLAGIVTIYPDFEPLNAVFGLSQIVWFVWVGVVMLARRSPELMPSAT